MKEAVGETSLTLITVILVGAAITALTVVIGYLLTNQGRRSSCENSGGTFSGGECSYTNSNGNVVPCACEKNTCVCED